MNLKKSANPWQLALVDKENKNLKIDFNLLN